MINKILAGAITLAFMTFVRPDPQATQTGIALTSVLLFAGLDYSIGYIRKVNKKHYTTVTRREDRVSKADIQRWSDEWITWPMHEVREDA